jgi:hypothetical protein
MIESAASLGVHMTGYNGLVEIHATRIIGVGNALSFVHGKAYIDAFEIYSSAGDGVYYNSYYSDPLHLRVARIVSNYNSSSARAIKIDSGSGGVHLYRSILVVHSNASYSLGAASSTNVRAMGASYGNKDKDSNVTIQVGSFTQNGSVV